MAQKIYRAKRQSGRAPPARFLKMILPGEIGGGAVFGMEMGGLGVSTVTARIESSFISSTGLSLYLHRKWFESIHFFLKNHFLL